MFTKTERLLELDIPSLAADKILPIELDGEDYLSYPFYFEITFLTDNHNLSSDKLITQPVTVSIGSHSNNPQKYNGKIYAIRAGKINSAGLKSYNIIVTPWLRFLDTIIDSRTYGVKTPQSIPEIITQIFKDHGYTDYDISKLTRVYPKLHYSVQYQETYFNYISRLLDTAGIYYYFTHTDNKHTLVLEDSGYLNNNTVTATYNNADQEQPHIHKWTRNRRLMPTAIAMRSYDFQKPKHPLNTKLKNKNSQLPFKKLENYQYGETHPGITQKELDNQARSWLQSNNTQSEKIKASSNYHQFHAGTAINLIKHEIASETGQYYIYAIRHQAHDTSGIKSHGDKDNAQAYSNQFRAYLAQNPFTPLARYNELTYTPLMLDAPLTTQKHQLTLMHDINKPNIDAPNSAIVTGPAGKEIYTDKYGRVKVQFHWDRHSNKDENSSCWIRVSQLFAGDGYGSSFIPRIGTEVIVEYEHGNPDKPIITGVVPNEKTPMPFEPEQNPLQTGIRSHSFGSDNPEDGNEIRFEDTAGHEEIHIKAQKDLTIQIDGDSEQNIGADAYLTIEEGDYNISVDGILTVTAEKRIAMSCGTSELIITPSDITVQADSIDLKQGSVNIPVPSDLTGTALLNATVAKLNSAGAAITKATTKPPSKNQTYWVKTTYLTPDQKLNPQAKSFSIDNASGTLTENGGSITLTKTEELKQLNIANHEIAKIAGEKVPYPSDITKIKATDFKAIKASDLPHEKPKPTDKIITAEALYPPLIINLRGDKPTTTLTPEQMQYIRNHGKNITIFIHGYNVPLGKYPQHFSTIKKEALFPDVVFVPTESDTSCTIYRDLTMLKQKFPSIADMNMIEQQNSGLDEGYINGTDAHNWFIHMEDNLNRATGQFDRSDYSKYTRLLHITWHGNILAGTDFPGAEDSADKAGILLVETIQQLHKAGIEINIIAHSLGNRVLLKAMDILGETESDIMEHVFLWEAAVPQTALSNDPTKDTSVRGNGKFINAYKTAKKITVLYSDEDSVLSFWYPLDKHLMQHVVGNLEEKSLLIGRYLQLRNNSLYMKVIGGIFPAEHKEYTHELKEVCDKLQAALNKNKYCQSLGYMGPDMKKDKFIKHMLSSGKLIRANCSKWIGGHSVMRDPTPEIMKHVYHDLIIKAPGFTFGNYKL